MSVIVLDVAWGVGNPPTQVGEWATGGTATNQWYEQSGIVYSGPTAYKIDEQLENDTFAWVETYVEGPGFYKFAIRQDTAYRNLRLYRNGVYQGRLSVDSTNTGWWRVLDQFEVAEGGHVLRWATRIPETFADPKYIEIVELPVDPGYINKSYTLEQGCWTEAYFSYTGTTSSYKSGLDAYDQPLTLRVEGTGLIEFAIYEDNISFHANGHEVFERSESSTGIAQTWEKHSYFFGSHTGGETVFEWKYSRSRDAYVEIIRVVEDPEISLSQTYIDSFAENIKFLLWNRWENNLSSVWSRQTDVTYGSDSAWVNGYTDDLSYLRMFVSGLMQVPFAWKSDTNNEVRLSCLGTGSFSYYHFANQSGTSWEVYTPAFSTEGEHYIEWEFHSYDINTTSDCAWLDILGVERSVFTEKPSDAQDIILNENGWEMQTENTFNASKAWKSDATDALLCTLLSGPATVEFYWMTGANSSIEFIVNGNTVGTLGANSFWTVFSYQFESDRLHSVYWKAASGTENYVQLVGGFFVYPPCPSLKHLPVILPKSTWTIVSGDNDHIVGIKSDGTCRVAGAKAFFSSLERNKILQDVPTWTDIEKVHLYARGSSYHQYYFGIKTDQTTVGRFWNADHTRTEWVSDLSCCVFLHRGFGLRSDGTLMADGGRFLYHGQQSFEKLVYWDGIVKFAARAGLRVDGTIVMAGSSDSYGQLTDAPSGNDFVDISYYSCYLALRSDGTAYAWGGYAWGEGSADNAEAVGGWTDVVQVASGLISSYGLRSDGTVLYAGDNTKGEGDDVATWSNINFIFALRYYVVGIKSDGTAVAGGSDEDWYGHSYGAIEDVNTWTGMRTLNGVEPRPVCLRETEIKALTTTVTWDWVY